MFVFLFILLIHIIFALPLAKQRAITDVYIEGTTIVPHDRIPMAHVQKPSSHLHKSVNALQSVMKTLFSKKDQPERNLSIDRQLLLIGCVINRANATEKQRRACKKLFEQRDKNVYYGFEDKSLEQKETVKENNRSPIHVEHINVARVKNNKEKPINDTMDEIQKLINTEHRLINNEIDRKKMHFGLTADLPSSPNLIHRSTFLNVSSNVNHGGMFPWSTNNNATDKTVENPSDMETVKQVPQFKSTYLFGKQNDNNDDVEDFKTMKTFSKLDKNNFSLYNEENIVEENDDDSLDINKSSNESTIDLWNIGQFLNDPAPKNALLTDLTKALETLETIVDGQDFDLDGDQISFKPADLYSIINSQKFS